MSALDLNGITVTIMRADGKRKDEILQYIDLKVDSPNWPKIINLEEQNSPVVELNIHNYAA
jgi:hypothetical protein